MEKAENYKFDGIRKYFRFTSSPVLHLGSKLITGRPTKDFFEKRNRVWIGLDIQRGKNVSLKADAHYLPFPNESIGMILCGGLLEHVRNPIKVSEEMRRVLKPGSLIYVGVPFRFGVHNYPHDYWRFTPEALIKIILKDFRILEIKHFKYGKPLKETLHAFALKN